MVLHSRENVFAREFDGEIVLLDLDQGVYYGLDRIATLVWKSLLEQNQPLAAVVREVVTVFEVDEQTVQRDITALTQDWMSKGLVEDRS